jgi:ABC-type bacteriocin/lantibiotic exporter with double-glycine peptidase domain
MTVDVLRLQDQEANCGPAAGVAALAAIGLRVAPRAMESLSGYTPALGTPVEAMRRGLEACGAFVRVMREGRASVAWPMILGAVRGGASAVALVDNDSHWVAITGVCGDRVNVFDPARGPYVLSRAEFLDRWQCEGERLGFYAQLVTPDGG